MFRRASLVAAGALALAAASSVAFADDSSPLPAGARVATITPAASVAHVLVNDHINSASAASVTLDAGFNNLDAATTIKCNNAAGCTFSVGSMVQISPPAGTYWAICALVDGTYMTPGCPYQGTVPAVGTYVTGNARFNYAVAQGTHTVQSQVYVSATSTLGNWQVDYMLYKP